MSRVDEVTNLVRLISRDNVVPKGEWITFLLMDIAVSLATIADALSRKDGETQEG